MSAATHKVKKAKGEKISDFEVQVATELHSIEMAHDDLKATLNSLHIHSAKNVDVAGGKSAVVVEVPFPELKTYQKVHQRVVRELEKKLSGKHVVLVGRRKILGTNYARSQKVSGPRPRSRTLTTVHEALLEDITYPTEIVGKRTRCKVDGSKQLKVLLDPKQKADVEGRTDTFQAVYKALVNKDVLFDFA